MCTTGLMLLNNNCRKILAQKIETWIDWLNRDNSLVAILFLSPSDPCHVVGVYDEYRPQGTGDADVSLLSSQHSESFNEHHHKNDSLYWG